MSAKKNSVRMGPISLFTLIAVIVLAVMAVLALVTGNAATSVSSRQAHATASAYELEVCAQRFYANVDSNLALSLNQELDEDAALQVLSDALPSLLDGALSSSGSEAEASAKLVGTQVVAEFGVSERHLAVILDVSTSQGAKVAGWKLTSVQQTSESETLWRGTSN